MDKILFAVWGIAKGRKCRNCPYQPDCVDIYNCPISEPSFIISQILRAENESEATMESLPQDTQWVWCECIPEHSGRFKDVAERIATEVKQNQIPKWAIQWLHESLYEQDNEY